MAGRLSGLGMAPQVPFYTPPAITPDELEMMRAAKVYEEMQRELRTHGRTLDSGAILYSEKPKGLGPIAQKRLMSGDLPWGVQPGSGDRKRMKPASAVEKARADVAQALDKPIQKLGKMIDYYGGPHVSEALGRSAQAIDYGASMVPVLGDMRDLTTMAVEGVDDALAGDWMGAAGAVGLGALSLGMFLPPGVKGAPMDTLDIAKKMEKAGASPEEIWAETSKGGRPGWWKNAAGQWRWELDDSKMKLTPKGATLSTDPRNTGGYMPMQQLETIVDHPELWDAQPQIADMYGRVLDDGGPAGAFYPPEGATPSMLEASGPRTRPADNYRMPKNQMQTLAHELQHAVQFGSNGPQGSMPSDPDIGKAIPQRAILAANPQLGQISDYNTYRRSAGEVEANLTAFRQQLTPDERAARFPGAEMEFPATEQWVRMNDGSIAVPDANGNLIPVRGPQRGWWNADGSPMASQGASGGRVMASAEEGATPVPGTNGPRQRRSQRTGPTSEELLQQAVSTPRRVSQRGTFVGAPPGVDTPEAEQALIADLYQRLQNYQGSGERFYDDFQGAIRQYTEDPVMARRFVSSSGHTSNQMSPLPNTTHALKAMNQYAVGDPVQAGLYPNTSGPKAAESMAADRLSPDPKTGQYSYALLPPELRPADYGSYAFGGERAVRGRAVHDTWDKVAFGYAPNAEGKQNAASDTEHLFMDRAYNRLVNMVSRNPELRAKYGTGPQAYERIQAALWDIARGEADKFDVLPADEILRRHMGFTQMAAIPGPSTGVDPALLNAPLDVKRQYTDEMFNALSTPDGRNIPAASLGMTPPMQEGFGPWQGMMEPNRTIQYGAGSTGSGGDKAIDPASATAQRAMRHQNQFIFGQEGSGFTYPSDAGATRKASDLVTIGGTSMTSDKAFDDAMKAVEKVYGPNWADNVVVQPVPGTNELMLKNISGGNNQEFAKMAQEVSKLVRGGKISGLRDIGNDFTYVQFSDPSYRTLMDETRNNPVLKKTFDEKVLPRLGDVQAASERWAKRLGISADTVPDRVRRIFIQAGENWPQAMDEAVKKGLIPAFALPIVYGALGGQFEGEEGGVQ